VKAAFVVLAFWPLMSLSQAQAGTRELVGTLGSRDVLVVLHSVPRADGSWRITGEYIVLPTLQRRYLEGERGPELGVTTLKEGATAILFGHDATGELRGTWRAGAFKGTRYGPGGQERERFEFNEDLPSMARYGASVHCRAEDGRYSSTLDFSADAGQVARLEWRSRLEPGGHSCRLSDLRQQPFKGGLRLAAGACTVTLREVGGLVKVAAQGCNQQCGSQAYLEPLLIDRRGNCRLLRPEAR
jgi:hypothetical protein